jgi:glycosyltransferase involved in cell wall biosynthesis
MEEGVSIIICTYNRASILQHCLQALLQQTVTPNNVEVIVVDNLSTDNTKAVITSFQNQIIEVRYEVATVQGSSAARNKGVAVSKFNWVCFLDDDAKPHPDFVERLFYIKNNYSFDGFGGMFYPWYIQPKPKWLPIQYGAMPQLLPQVGPLTGKATVAGGICAFNKQKIIEVGLFPTEVGMKGNKQGYAEEDVLQLNLLKNGGIIGFDPLWKIDHLVAPYKYKVSWHLQRSFAKGRDYQLTKAFEPLPFGKRCSLLFRTLLQIPYLMVRFLPALLFKKNYYWQNYCLHVLSHPFKIAGKLLA